MNKHSRVNKQDDLRRYKGPEVRADVEDVEVCVHWIKSPLAEESEANQTNSRTTKRYDVNLQSLRSLRTSRSVNTTHLDIRSLQCSFSGFTGSIKSS